MASVDALCENAAALELKEQSSIRPSPESISALDACLLDVYRTLRPSPAAYEQRAVLIQALNVMAKDALGTDGGFPVVEAFGSFTMDLFTVGSDLDLSINFNDDYTTQIPRDQKISTLRKFTKFLYKLKRKGVISKVSPVLRARVPVVKVVDSDTGIECDVSAENKDGCSRSSILRIVASIDERFRILSYLMKAWANAHDINSSRHHTMNSLSIIALVAFHLQTRDPPILPPFSALVKDGTDVSSIQKVALGFKNFGSRNEESIANLFGTLLIKLSAVESLWPQGLCASTFEGSWIKKEWETKSANHVAYISIEDFLGRSENCARSVGQFGVKKIYNCIKGSLTLLSRFLDGEIGEIELKELLFGSSLNVPNVQLTGEQMGSKKPISICEPDPAHPISAKRARKHPKFKTTSSTRPNPRIPLTPRPSSQNSHVEDRVNSFEHLQSGYEPQHRQYPPITTLSNPTDWLAPFPHGHMENRLNPFETPQTWRGPYYQPQSQNPPHRSNMPQAHPQRPFPSQSPFGFEFHGQPPSQIPPHLANMPQAHPHPHRPISSQSSFGFESRGQPPSQIPPHLSNMPQAHPRRPFSSQTSFGFESQGQPPSQIPPHLANMPQAHHWRPFSSQSFGFESQGQPPTQIPQHLANMQSQRQPPSQVPPHLANMPQVHPQRPFSSQSSFPHEGHRPWINAHDPNMPQSRYGIDHHPHQASFASGHRQTGRNL